MPLFRNGSAVIDLTHVDDVVSAILAILKAPDAARGKVYNVSGGQPLPVRTIIERAAGKAGVAVSWKRTRWPIARAALAATEAWHRAFKPTREPVATVYSAGLLAFSQTMDIGRIQNEIGWRPDIDFDQGLERTFRGCRMNVAFFNSAVVRAPALLMCKGASWRRTDVPVRFGLVQLATGKFHLIDTGYGPRVTAGQRSASLRIYNQVLRPILVEESSPKAVLASLGATPDDVESVIVTHFHADHVARLDEFPGARIVTSDRAARTISAASNRQAVRHGVFKELLPPDLMSRLDPIEGKPLVAAHPALGQGHDLLGNASLLAIDLPGHADGHIGLFWQDETGPTLYATDATWSMKALLEDRTPAISRKVVFDDPHAGPSHRTLHPGLRGCRRQGSPLP